MNILLINHYAGSIQHGMEYRPFYLAREWVRAGHEVTILAASFSHVRSHNPKTDSNWQESYVDGVRYLWVKTPSYSGNGYRRAINIFSFVGQLLLHQAQYNQDPPDVIIASSTYPLDIVPAARMAKKNRARLIFEVHDLWPLTLIEIGGLSSKHPFILLLQWAEDYAYRKADRVVSLLPKADEYMVRHGMQPNKFVHIPNGIDIKEWEGQDEALPSEYQEALIEAKKQGNFLIGYTGAHGIANALDTIIDSASLLHHCPVCFVLIGKGPEKARLQARCINENITNVHFLPPIEKKFIPAILAEMDILYIGLKDEPLFRYGVSPNKLIDYMMAGKPIIYAINAGNDPVTEAGCGISVPSENPEAIAAAVKQLISMPFPALAEMGERGREYCLEKHNYESLALSFLHVFE